MIDPFSISSSVAAFGRAARQSASQAMDLFVSAVPATTAAPAARPFPVLTGSDGFASNVPRSLIATESGGNWQARNNEVGAGGKRGHFGLLQFGQARLEDAKRAGIMPKDMTPEQFMADPETQKRVINWHFADIDQNIRKAGFDRLIGKKIGSVSLTMDGMRAMAHLGGFGGLSRFIRSGGRYNPSDSFGTTIAAYGQRHAS